MSRTYLQHCLHGEVLARWPDGAMPIRVYIAPFQWYEKKKQQQSQMYHQMVLDAFNAWKIATNGLVRFQFVGDIHSSQIDLKWRRVERSSLGKTYYEIDDVGRIFTASIEIGITDGVIHQAYEHTGEVMHTIIHEVGHALGLLGHSDQSQDIMYVPHQYGVYALSPRDKETLLWLYQLPLGFHYRSVAKQYRLQPGYSINDVILAIEGRIKGDSESPSAGTSPPPPPQQRESLDAKGKPFIKKARSLDEQHEMLSEMNRFHLKTQNISTQLGLKRRPPKPHQTIYDPKFRPNQPEE